MTHPNPSTALARVVVDELAAGGTGFIAISPGSRSGALAIAAAEHPDIETSVVIDERSAAFRALGVARATGRPAAVVATSGSAPANFFPAIVEADMSGVPLIAISADRPQELRGVGANQTIDQKELYGSKVRAFLGLEAAESDVDGNEPWRRTVRDLLVAASGRPMPGPVHLNVAFREPTVPVTDDGRTKGDVYDFPTPRIGFSVPEVGEERSQHPVQLSGSARGLIIAGDGEYERVELAREAERLGWPVAATAMSGMRGGDVVSTYHFLLHQKVPGELTPDVVVAIGAIGPDPVLEDLVASAGVRIRVDRWGRHIDPFRNATRLVAADPVEILRRAEGAADQEWREVWTEADASVRARVVANVETRAGMSGGGVAHVLNRLERGALVVASSLPIREIDAHLTTPGPVFANRGASGIDGFVSMALGVASYVPGTVALAGDLSLLHDSNGFLCDDDVDLTIVVIDNGGGGLFDSLPQARHAPQFDRLFITPPERKLVDLLRFHGVRVNVAETTADIVDGVDAGLRRPGLDAVVVPVDRRYDLAVRSETYQ